MLKRSPLPYILDETETVSNFINILLLLVHSSQNKNLVWKTYNFIQMMIFIGVNATRINHLYAKLSNYNF